MTCICKVYIGYKVYVVYEKWVTVVREEMLLTASDGVKVYQWICGF